MEQGDQDGGDQGRELRRAVSRALAEDLGDAGDVTSAAVVPPGTTATAVIVARQPGVVAGIDLVAATYAQLDGRVQVQTRVEDGEPVAGGQVLAELRGPLRSLLTGERVALNLLGHLSGVATLTHRFVTRAGDADCRVRDTRKTTPGLRVLEKAAVRAGGGENHRMGLHDALLVKDNHVVAAGGAGAAARAALSRADGRPVEVEVEDLDQLDEVLDAGVTDVLLDNFTLDALRAAVERTAGRARLEASGGIDLETVEAVAATGVDRVAVGALTHSAPALDVALDIAAEEVEVPAAFRRARRDAGSGPDPADGAEDRARGDDPSSAIFDEDLEGVDAVAVAGGDDTEDIFSPETLGVEEPAGRGDAPAPETDADEQTDPDGEDPEAPDPAPANPAGASGPDGGDGGAPGHDDPEPLSELFAERRAGDG